jgi:hypothetical protein
MLKDKIKEFFKLNRGKKNLTQAHLGQHAKSKTWS